MFRCLNLSLYGSSEANKKKKICALCRLQGWYSFFNQATFIGLYTTYIIGFHYAVKMCKSHEKDKLYLTIHVYATHAHTHTHTTEYLKGKFLNLSLLKPNSENAICHVINLLSQVDYIQGVYKRMVRFQKLTRNLFLTLHGQNVHRQQRQLSKFLMRYQPFASHA